MALTRKQAQQETRRKLLEAAMTLAAADGIAALSTRAICAAAGLTQGAFYSNFSGKDDLLVALMEQHLNREIENLQDIAAATAARSLPDLLAVLAEHFATLGQNRGWLLLSVELQVHALRDPAFAEQYDATRATYLDALAEVMSTLMAAHGLRTTLPVRQLAAGLHALWTGMSVQARAGDTPSENLLVTFFTGLVGTTDKPETSDTNAKG